MIDRPAQDIDGLLDRFRRWLETSRQEAEAIEAEEPHADRPEFGLINLVEEFTALRHEVKLQTKSGRGVVEQAESMVAALRQAIEQFRSVEPKEGQAAWNAGKAIAEAVGDLDESLARGRREIERISRRIGEDTTLALADAIDERFRRQSWMRRILSADYHRQVQNVVRGGTWLRRDLLDALLEGYGLIQSRLARVMSAEGIARIPCEGRPVDPERMVVIEVVDSELAPGTVIKELRSGYTWKGRLLRYAEVQAAGAASGGRPSPPGEAPGEDDLDDFGPDGEDFDEEEGNLDLEADGRPLSQ
jgi:molecular chaperone GrpE